MEKTVKHPSSGEKTGSIETKSHDFKPVSYEMETISYDMKTISYEMEIISYEMKTISYDMEMKNYASGNKSIIINH
jgi:hypothetical protein